MKVITILVALTLAAAVVATPTSSGSSGSSCQEWYDIGVVGYTGSTILSSLNITVPSNSFDPFKMLPPYFEMSELVWPQCRQQCQTIATCGIVSIRLPQMFTGMNDIIICDFYASIPSGTIPAIVSRGGGINDGRSMRFWQRNFKLKLDEEEGPRNAPKTLSTRVLDTMCADHRIASLVNLTSSLVLPSNRRVSSGDVCATSWHLSSGYEGSGIDSSETMYGCGPAMSLPLCQLTCEADVLCGGVTFVDALCCHIMRSIELQPLPASNEFIHDDDSLWVVNRGTHDATTYTKQCIQPLMSGLAQMKTPQVHIIISDSIEWQVSPSMLVTQITSITNSYINDMMTMIMNHTHFNAGDSDAGTPKYHHEVTWQQICMSVESCKGFVVTPIMPDFSHPQQPKFDENGDVILPENLPREVTFFSSVNMQPITDPAAMYINHMTPKDVWMRVDH